MSDNLMYWIDQIVRNVPIVTWVGLLLAVAMATLWFSKKWPATPVLTLVCVLYAITPYMPTMQSM